MRFPYPVRVVVLRLWIAVVCALWSSNAMSQDISLSANAISGTQITLNWSTQQTFVPGSVFVIYRVYPGNEEALYFGNSWLVGDGTSYTVCCFAHGETVSFIVQRDNCNDTCVTYRSNEATATTFVLPNAPSGLRATTASGSQINLSWTDNSNNEVHFILERKTGGGSYTTLAWLQANVTSFSDTGLSSGTNYQYRVSALNNLGQSGYSNEAAATTHATSVDPKDVIFRPRADLAFAGQNMGTIQVLGRDYDPASPPPEEGVFGADGSMRFGRWDDPTASRKVFRFESALGDVETKYALRTEMRAPTNIDYDKVYWIALRLYVFNWGPGTGEEAIFGMQVHDGQDNKSIPGPSFGIYTWNDKSTFQIQCRYPNNPPNHACAPNRSLPFGQWIDFVFKLRHNVEGNGLLQVWMNGERIADHSSKPNQPANLGFPKSLAPNYYAKFGYYTWDTISGVTRRTVLIHSPMVISDASERYTPELIRGMLYQ